MNKETLHQMDCDIYHYESLADVEPLYRHSLQEIISDVYLRNPDMQYLLAVDDHEEFVGVVAFTTHADTARLCEIFVEDVALGTGVAKQLMEDFEETNLGKVKHLTVESENERAIRFYRKCGYDILNDSPSANLHLEKE